MSHNVPDQDLTRWNRPGLERFRYVNANAATHLEAVLKKLHEDFPGWPSMGAELPDKDDQARLERLLDQLYADRKDWGYEITRAFCRALHITSEHIDAFANESYLQTATQWESLRRLVAMIGYLPRPQSSAATPLAILAPEDTDPAVLAKGTAVKNVPSATIPALIFETGKDLLVDPDLNALRLEDWDVNPDTFNPFHSSADWPVGDDSKIDVGQVAILTVKSKVEGTDECTIIAHPTKIEKVEVTTDPAGKLVKIEVITALEDNPKRGETSLVAAPKSVLTPILNNDSTIRFEHPHGLGIGETIHLKSGGKNTFATVQNADKYAVTLALPAGITLLAIGDSIKVYRTRRLTKQQRIDHLNEWILAYPPSTSAFLTYFTADLAFVSTASIETERIVDNETTRASGLYEYEGAYKLTAGDLDQAEEVIISDPVADELIGIASRQVKSRSFDFEGAPPKLSSGDWLMAATGPSDLTPVRIESIERGDGEYKIHLAAGTELYVDFFHAEFQETLRPLDYNINRTPLEDFYLVPDKAPWPLGLVAGRDIIFENMDEEGSGGVAARVIGFKPVPPDLLTDIGAAGLGVKILETDLKPEDYTGFTIGNLVIRANIVVANHGETKPIRVLGNGDASQTSQSFVFEADDVTHVADPAFAGGVRADVEVWAGNVRFTQVDELRNSEPSDTHYRARLNQDGHLILTFGDGQHARRLPTGINNMQIRYRVGGGEVGNVPAYTLTKPAGKSALIEEVRQPLLTAGGGAAEPLEEMRRNAPSSVQAMNRAVSLRDYESLANQYAGVWHAVAFEEKRLGREGDVVVIAVMPAGAVPYLGTLEGALQSNLEAHGLPGVPVEVRPYVPARPELTISLLVDETRFVIRDIMDAVVAALLDEFQPKNRRPGRPLHRSEIVAVIENVEGVSSSVVVELSEPVFEPDESGEVKKMRRVRLGSEGAIWSLWPEPDCAVFFDLQSVIHISPAGEAP